MLVLIISVGALMENGAEGERIMSILRMVTIIRYNLLGVDQEFW